jgi:SPP1 gp7 family putative phage head morphogenesis protein
MKKINAETLQGILQGESMDKIAKRLRSVQEMNKTQAIRSARTIVTGAENKGRQDSYARAEADGIILQKEWIATNDNRTRHWHAELDGQTVPQDKPFSNAVGLIMFPGDPGAHPSNTYNCRCTMAAVVKGFGQVKIKEEVFVGQSGGVQFLGLRQTGDIDESEFTEGKKAGESFVKKPTRPKKLDYANEEEYMQAREKYRSDREAYEKQIDRIVSSAMQNQAFTTKEQAVEWARKIGITIDPDVFEAVDLRSFNEVKSTLEEMFEGFPQVRGYDFEDFDGVIRRVTFNIGLTDIDGVMLGSGGIKFNGRYFADYETALRDVLGSMADGFTVVGDGSFSTAVRHEFGHNVQQYIETGISRKYHASVDDWRIHYKSFDDWKVAEKAYFDERHQYDEELRALAGLRGSSEYSTTNENELFAEGFAEWASGGTSEFAEAFGKFFERWFK